MGAFGVCVSHRISRFSAHPTPHTPHPPPHPTAPHFAPRAVLVSIGGHGLGKRTARLLHAPQTPPPSPTAGPPPKITSTPPHTYTPPSGPPQSWRCPFGAGFGVPVWSHCGGFWGPPLPPVGVGLGVPICSHGWFWGLHLISLGVRVLGSDLGSLIRSHWGQIWGPPFVPI